MRPINKNSKNGQTYSPYGNAKPDLIEMVGPFCSYCERRGYSTAIDVEHVKNKNDYPELKEIWDNFLLACKNCNSIKGTKDFDFNQIHMPHLNNTFSSYDYSGGSIQLSSSLNLSEKNKAQKLADLVGLFRRPGRPKYSSADLRWKERYEAFNKANRYLEKYDNNQADIETICDLTIATGFWSVWMTVFQNQPEVLSELLNCFPGTNTNYFNL